MIWIILAILLGPSALILTIGWFSPVQAFLRSLNIQQPPWWIREVMGLRFSLARAVLFAWWYWPAISLLKGFRILRSKICQHTFDKSYGESFEGEPDLYCSKCFKWRDGNGFCE